MRYQLYKQYSPIKDVMNSTNSTKLIVIPVYIFQSNVVYLLYYSEYRKPFKFSSIAISSVCTFVENFPYIVSNPIQISRRDLKSSKIMVRR